MSNKELVNFLDVLNNEKINIDLKFKEFVSFSDKTSIIDIIVDSPYDDFIDLFYRYGKDICSNIDYYIIKDVDNLRRELGKKSYDSYIKNLRLIQEKLDLEIEAKNTMLRLILPNLYRKNYVGNIHKSKLFDTYFGELKFGIEPDVIDYDKLLDYLRVLFRDTYEFRYYNGTETVKVYKK